MLHLIYLFLIVLLPITTSLAGRSLSEGVAEIYGTHLALLGSLNLVLWLDVHRRVAAHTQIAGSAMVLILFLAALGCIAMQQPAYAKYFWLACFVVPWFSGPVVRLVWRR